MRLYLEMASRWLRWVLQLELGSSSAELEPELELEPAERDLEVANPVGFQAYYTEWETEEEGLVYEPEEMP